MDFDEASTTPPPGWTPGQWSRVQKLRAQRDEARELASSTATALETAQGELTTTRSRLTTTQQDAVMRAEGGDFAHPEVRQWVRRGYADYTAEAGDKPMTFEEWFAAETTRTSPVFSRFFQQAAPANPDEAGAPPEPAKPPTPGKPPAIDPNAGREPAPRGAGHKLSEKQIQEAADDPRTWSEKREAIREQLGLGKFERKSPRR